MIMDKVSDFPQHSENDVTGTINGLPHQPEYEAGQSVLPCLADRTPWRHVTSGREMLKDTTDDIEGIIAALNQTQNALRESEERYRTVLENIQDGYFECDLTGKILFCNESFCRINGLDRDTILQADFRDYVAPETADQIYQAFHQVYLSGAALPSFEVEVVKPDGSSYFVEESVSLLRNEQGVPCGFCGIVRDTTERRLAEDIRRESEEKFRVLANEAPVMIWLTGPDSLSTFLNQRWLEFTGRSLEQELGNGWMDCVHCDDLAGITALYEAAYERRAPVKLEYRAKRHDGVYRWLLDCGLPRYSPDGEFLGYIGSCFDITDRKEAEENLGQSEERYRTILENIHDGYYEVDLAGRLTFANDGLVRMLGLESKEKLLGANMLKFADEANARRLRETANRVYRLDEPLASFVYEIRQDNGTRRDVDISLSPMKNGNGQAIGFRGILRDVSERKRNERLIAGQVNVLEMIATGAPLTRTLEAIVKLVEELSPEALCSILLLDEAGEKLSHGAANRLPAEYVRQIDGVSIGPNVGSCGAAVHRKQLVVATDIASDPLWTDYREVAIGHGLRACWSVPIFSPTRRVLGTFAVYYNETRAPQPYEVSLMDPLTHLASIVIERARAEAKLQASETRFRALTEKSAEGISLFLPDATLIYTSPAIERITGYASAEVLGTKIENRIHPEDRPLFRETVSSLSQTPGSSTELRFRSRHKNGIWRWIDAAITNLLEEPGVQAIAINYRDITERIQAEQALRENERETKFVLKVSEVGTWRLDLTTDELTSSEICNANFGLSLEDTLSYERLRQELIHPEDVAAMTAAVNDAIETGQDYNAEYRCVTPDGEIRWIMAKGRVVYGPDGTPLRMSGTSQNITARKLAEEELRQSEERFRTLVGSLDEGVVMQNADSTILTLNASAERILGLPAAKLLGSSAFDPRWKAIYEDGSPFPGEMHPAVQALRTGQPCLGVVMGFRRRNGAVTWISVNSQPLFRQGAAMPYAVVSSFSDITERKLAEDALRASEERFARAFHASPQPMAILELPSRTYTNANEALLRNSGFTREEIIGRNPNELDIWVDPADAQRVAEMLEQDGFIRNLETRFRTKTGEIREFLYSAEQILFDSQPHVLVVANDITERKRAEEAMRQSEALLHSVIDSNPDWIFVKDINHRYKLVNRSYADALHLRVEDFLGKNDLELGFPEDQVKGNPEKGIRGFWPADREVFTTGRIQFVEEDPAEIDGQTHLFNTIKVPLKSEDGKVWGVLGVGRDLTSLRQVETALRASEERFARAFDASPQPMVIFEASERRIVNVNEAMVRTFGWTAAEMIGRTPADLDIWVDLEQQTQVRSLLISQGFVRDLEIKFRTKTGEIREFLYAAETINLDNQPHILVVANDITERVRMERALMESEERYRLLFEHGFTGISQSRLDGQMLDCNDALARLFGYESREEMLKVRTPDLYFDLGERRRLAEALKRNGSVRNYERLMKRRDGSPVWTLANITLFSGNGDSEPLVEGVILDITERKLIEQQLAQSTAEMRALSARLETIREEERTRIAREIHDNLGQALTGLKLEFSWLDKNLTRATDQNLRRKAIPKLKEIAQLLEETIQTVRHIATELRPSVLDTLGLSAAIDWQSREFARRSGIQCQIQLCHEPEGFPPERATALFRVFQEILTNIARHSQARKFIVNLAQSNGDLVMTVWDDGVGITKDQFLDPKSLGLIGMRERVLIFGGTVQIEGQHEGRTRGTVVKVKMPATR